MNRCEAGEPHLHCDICDATPALGTAGDGVSGGEGYLEGSDCPACDEGQLVECDEDYDFEDDDYLEDYDEDYADMEDL